eukprot:271570_1
MDLQYKTNSMIVYIAISLIYVLLLPICILFIRVIWIKRTSLIMRKRYVYASICGCVCLCIVLFIERPASLFVHLYRTHHGHTTTFSVLECLQLSLRMYGLQGFVYAILYRFWCAYFDFMYNDSLQRERWKLQINPHGCTASEQWILDHHKDYGNTQWSRKRFFMIWITVSTMASILYFFAAFYTFEWHTWVTVLYFAPFVGNVVIWFKFPPFLDSIYLKYELKALIICYALAVLFKISIDIMIRVTPSMTQFAANVAWTGHTTYICIMGIFIQTQYVWNKVPQNSNANVNAVQSGGNRKKLREVFDDSASFNLFVAHLRSELSMECIFSFIEFTQFEAFIEADASSMKQINSDVRSPGPLPSLSPLRVNSVSGLDKSQDVYGNVVLLGEDTIPLSHIVHVKYANEQDDQQRYKYIVKDLVDKYIVSSAAFCINIDYKTRVNILNWAKKHCYGDAVLTSRDLNEMYCLFDRSRQEMYFLMKHTLSRFVKTEEYKTLMRSREDNL